MNRRFKQSCHLLSVIIGQKIGVNVIWKEDLQREGVSNNK